MSTDYRPGDTVLSPHTEGISNYFGNSSKLPQARATAPVHTRPDSDNEIRKATLPPRQTSGKKKKLMTSIDREDKTLQLERENNLLKEKENILSREIKTMETKLRRIETLINQRAKYGDKEGMIIDVQTDLQNECDQLKVANEAAREKVRKLKVIERGLATRPAGTSAKVDKFAHVQGKLDVNSTAASKKYAEEADEMRAQLVANNRKKLDMEHQIELLKVQNRGPADATKLRGDIQDMMKEQREIEHEMFVLENDQKQMEHMFTESRNYVSDIQKKIHETNADNERLRQENFRLQIKTQQVTDYESELKLIEKERDGIERSIKSILSEPFMRKNNEQPIAQRIIKLQEQLTEAENKSKSSTAHCKSLEEQITAKKQANQKLTYERDMLQVDYNKAKDEFTQKYGNKAPTEADAVQGLIQMDTSKYTNMLADLVMGDPSWAKLDFLERDQDRVSGPDGIKHEIQYLTQEKADLAGELEKSQNLLRLQSDIQRENDEFFKKEIERLQLVEKSAQAKLEELGRRADEKQRLLNQTEKQLMHEQQFRTGPTVTHKAGQEQLDLMEVQSEFSAMTNETELQIDENILDFKLEDAEYFFDNFGQVASVSHMKENDGSHFVTLLTVDFFNCPSETTGLAIGYKPNYNTQISFRNRVDKFYLANLERGSIKIDCYVSKNNTAVHIGQCFVLLRELLTQELIVDETHQKTLMMSAWARLLPVTSESSNGIPNGKPIGIVKYKMRLRKPIQEAWKYNRDQRDIENMTKAVEMHPETLRPRKKVVTISVVGCQDLNVAYADVREVTPFFFYQFFTFDDRYSKNGVGINPKFNDTFSYEVTFDARSTAYFEKESLEIILFDDNAPITTKELNGQSGANDDMIGIARIPLRSIATGASIHDKFPLVAPKSNMPVGSIEVKLSVMDLDALAGETIRTSEVTKLHFNQEWEQDMIMKIAQKLASLPVEVELIFGVFSSGQRTCTKEDFAYCCLTRLGLKQYMTDKEMNLFLKETDAFRDKDYIERDEFNKLFGSAIQKARNEQANQQAVNMWRSESNHSLERSLSNSVSNFQWRQMMDILGTVVKSGKLSDVTKSLGSSTITAINLKRILTEKGTISDSDASKVVNMIAVNSMVEPKKFEQLIGEVKQYWYEQSDSIRKVKEIVQRNIKACVKFFEAEDHNRDGELFENGFIAALRREEFRPVTLSDLQETFHLCAQSNKLHWQHWLESISRDAKQHFAFQSASPKLDESIQIQTRADLSTDRPKEASYSQYQINESKVTSACVKFENYMRGQDLSLGVVFTILDTNVSNQITFSEFRSHLHRMDTKLDEEEIMALFKSIDVNNDQVISYDELIEKFSYFNTQQLLKRISVFIMSGKSNADFIFDKYAKDTTRGRMNLADFGLMVKDFVKRATQAEILQMFKHFDRGGKSYITRQDFTTAFSTDVKDTGFSITIEDIIKPLATKLKRFKYTTGELFDKADKNNNFRISAQELADVIASTSSGETKLDASEVKMIHDYFYNRFNKTQINRAEFIELFETKFTNKSDEAEARKAQIVIKEKCKNAAIDVRKHIWDFNPEKSEKLNLRNFKRAVNELKCLTLYQIDNLAKYLDDQNEGFVSIDKFVAGVKNSATFADSFGRSSPSRKSQKDFTSTKKGDSLRTNKWAK